jgi:hypothetical protein
MSITITYMYMYNYMYVVYMGIHCRAPIPQVAFGQQCPTVARGGASPPRWLLCVWSAACLVSSMLGRVSVCWGVIVQTLNQSSEMCDITVTKHNKNKRGCVCRHRCLLIYMRGCLGLMPIHFLSDHGSESCACACACECECACACACACVCV